MPYCVKCGKPLEEDALFCINCGTPVSGKATPSQGQTAPFTSFPPPPPPISGIDAITKSQQAQDYWIKRVIASFIDNAIMAFVVVIITVIFTVPFMFSSMMSGELFSSPLSWTSWGLFPFLIGLGLILYFPISEANWGATFGKSIMGLRVTTLNGGKPNLGQAFIRNISKIHWVLLLLDVIVGLATQTDYRQKYSDRYIGTIVVLR